MCGEAPFGADTTIATLMGRVGATIEMPESLGKLGEILSQACAPELDDRLEAKGLEKALEELAAKLPKPAPLELVGLGNGLDPYRSSDTMLGTTSIGKPGSAVGTGGAATTGGARGGSGGAGSGDIFVLPSDLTSIGAVGSGDANASRSPGREFTKPFDYEDLSDGGERMLSGRGEGDGEGRGGRRPIRRLFKVGIPILIVALLAGGGAFAYEAKVFAPKYKLADLMKLTVGEAKAKVKHDQFKVVVTKREYNAGVLPGRIAQQDPAPGTQVAQGDTINVVLSLGPHMVGIPQSLVGKSVTDATTILNGLHLQVGNPAYDYDENIPLGDVIRWSPTGSVAWGTTITLVQSKGPKPRTIPNSLAGDTFAQAQGILQQMGLVAAQTQVYSSTVPIGQVVDSDPQLGSQVDRGSTVTLHISKGPQMVTVPDVRGENVDAATAALGQVGLQVSNVYGSPNKKVTLTNPPPGTSVAVGSGVDLLTGP